MQIEVIFSVIVLIFSVMIHEVAHGIAAEMQGDPTARMAGRITFNPIKHIDPFGSIILPMIMGVISGGRIMFGWAKPVPVNPYNFRNQRWGETMVAAAGPLSNIIVALIFGLLLRLGGPAGWFSISVTSIIAIIVIINLILAIFNLIPIPPLDGSKILFSFMPQRYLEFRDRIENVGLFVAIFFVFFLWQFIFPIIPILFRLITGVSI